MNITRFEQFGRRQITWTNFFVNARYLLWVYGNSVCNFLWFLLIHSLNIIHFSKCFRRQRGETTIDQDYGEKVSRSRLFAVVNRGWPMFCFSASFKGCWFSYHQMFPLFIGLDWQIGINYTFGWPDNIKTKTLKN